MRRLSTLVLAALLLVGCSDDGDEQGPAASVTTTTSADDKVKAEVEAAYLANWAAYTRAVRVLSTEGLDDVFAGEQLERTLADVRSRISQARAARIEVDHDYDIELRNDGSAIVRDRYVNHSVAIDPISGEPLEEDPREVVTETYTLRRIDGSWRVVDIVRA